MSSDAASSGGGSASSNIDDANAGSIVTGTSIDASPEALIEGDETGLNQGYVGRTLFLNGAPYPSDEQSHVQGEILSADANESGGYAAVTERRSAEGRITTTLSVGSLDSPRSLRGVLEAGFTISDRFSREIEISKLNLASISEGGNVLVHATYLNDVALLYSDGTVSTFSLVGGEFLSRFDLVQFSASDFGVVYSKTRRTENNSDGGFFLWDGTQNFYVIQSDEHHWEEDGMTDACTPRANNTSSRMHLTDAGSLYINGQLTGPDFLSCLDYRDSAVFRYRNGALETVLVANSEIPGLPGRLFPERIRLLGIIGEDTLLVRLRAADDNNSEIMIVDLDASTSYSLGRESSFLGNSGLGNVDEARTSQSGQILLHQRLDSRSQHVSFYDYASTSDAGDGQAEISGPHYIVEDPSDGPPDIEGIFPAHGDGVVVVAHSDRWNPVNDSRIEQDDESIVLWMIGSDREARRVIGEGDLLDVARLDSSATVVFEDSSDVRAHVDVSGNVLVHSPDALIALTKQ